MKYASRVSFERTSRLEESLTAILYGAFSNSCPIHF
jgi:hypothetical protein